ncbi:glycosyltransferase [Candidatus Pelagibacter sp.]|nr:glycosyltransferase [Candidatus Pelagibacter sp.]
MSINKNKLAIIIPVFNEQDIIEKVINDWLYIAKKFDGSIIVINDGSSDNSLKILLKIKKKNSKLIIVSKKNSGHGPTIYAGYKIALKKKFKFIFQVDSDDQFFSKDFNKLWTFRDDNSLILGFRKKRYDSFHRLIITKMLKILNLIIFRKFVPDANIPYRLMGYKFLIKNFRLISSKSLAPNILIAIKAARDNKIKSVVVSHKERLTGQVWIVKFNLIKFMFKVFIEIINFKKII